MTQRPETIDAADRPAEPVVSRASSSPRLVAWRVARLAAAWVLTVAALPYAWGRTLFVWMMVGRPEWQVTVLLGVVGGLIVLATVGVGRDAAIWRRRRLLGAGLTATWIAANAALLGIAAGSGVPRAAVAAVYAPASLFVVWSTWMFSGPWRWRARLVGLVGLGALLAAFLAHFEVQGLSGDSRVNFAWRRWRRPAIESAPSVGASTAASPAGILEIDPARDFPQFLGPDRSAALPHARLASDWSARPPRELWRRPVGVGWSSFAVVGQFAFTQETRGDAECVVCYRVTSGDEVWTHADKVKFTSSLGGPGPRATPTVSDGRVFAVGATGILNCLDALTGRRIWSVDVLRDNAAQNISHGVCGSPLVLDDRVVVSPTGDGGPSLVAYDVSTGRRVWAAGTDRASYSSPMVAELCGVRQILLFNAAGLTGHDAADGRPLWHFAWTNGVATNCSQPVVHAGGPNQILVSTGYGTGCALIRVDRSADDTWSVEQLWSNSRLKTKFCTAVVLGDHAYGLDDGVLACRDLATGAKGWKAGRYGHGQILLVDELLLVLSETGDIVLVRPDPSRLIELGRIHALDGKTWNNPALAGPYLIVRNDHEAACYVVGD